MKTKVSWTKEEINFLRRKYYKYGARYCLKYLHRTLGSIFTMANKMNLHEKKRYITRIDLNKLNTKEFSYILGFLWADGNIRKEMPVIRCQILKTDGEK